MITSANRDLGSVPFLLPVLRIPFSGGAGASGVRTTWEEGRGRGAAEEDSIDDEYPRSSVDP
jgi:hypothetical protein